MSPEQVHNKELDRTTDVFALGVENRGARGAPNRVVSERDEFVAEHGTAAQTADRDGHAAVTARVERRLRSLSQT